MSRRTLQGSKKGDSEQDDTIAKFFEVLNSIKGRACRGTSEKKTECRTRDMWGQSVVNSRKNQGNPFLD